jgi:hypothetical protein
MSMITQMLKSRGFAALVHAGLWLLLYFVITQLGGQTPPLRETTGLSAAPQSPAPVGRLPKLFAGVTWPAAFGDPAALNPFYTRHFVPTPAAAPPPPTTRKITVTFQGFYQTADSQPQVVYKVTDGFVVAPVGATVATNLAIANVDAFTLMLTNTAGQTNLLQLNKPTEVEVPLK